MSTPPSPPPPPPGPPPGLPPGPPGPSAPYGAPPPPGPRRGMSNKGLFWIGVVVGVFGAPALAIGLLVLLAVVSGSSDGPSVALQLLVVFVPVALVAAALVYRRSRWVALGALAGGAVVLIVLGGACIALISGLGQ
ncbi:hypothetical protein [Phycicoccus avicenniae]|uniref:hypothetical protein n=1 Tax=Phycicoccus avicenniae TaxID=2828860 RepID=UPI003D2D2105